MKKLLLILAMSLSIPALSQVINCPSGFTTVGTGACSISTSSATDDFWTNNTGTILSGTADILAPTGAGHNCNNLIRQAKVNVQAFTATWTFVMNGLNHAFVVENQTNQNGQAFCAGAGLEGGFVQFAGSGNIAPDKVFALQLDSSNPLTEGGSFTYSSAQWYETLQYPSHPLCCGGSYLAEFPITKQSTSPVPLNSPSSTVNTFTGDTYSATLTYDGYTLTLNMFDVTAGGSCPGASCYTKTWTGVYIPSIVGATTAWVGFASGTASPTPTTNLLINKFTYTVNTPTGSPSFTTWNANSTFNTGVSSAASPVYSVPPGAYATTQTVSITTSTGPNNYICYTLSPTTPTLFPHPDNNGGCSAGTLYTGPVSIPSTSTLYAIAGSNNSAFALGSLSPAGLGPPSTLVAGTYSIGTTYNVNSGMSTATIQGIMNTADATPGNTVQFAAGTYNLTTHLLPACQNGTIYTGPINSAGITPINNQWVQQTAASPAIINYVANGDSAIIFTGCSGSIAGQGATWQYLSGRYQIFTGGIPNVSSAATSAVLIQNNSITGNTAAFSNPAGVAIFMDYTTSNSTATHNYLSNCADDLDGCGSFAWSGTNNLIDSNYIAHTQEGVGSSGLTGGGGQVISGSTGGGITNNIFRGVNRLAIEITNGNNPGIVTGAVISGNLYIDPIGDPHISPFSGALSMATGNFGGAGSAGFTFHADDNTWIANTPFDTSHGNHMFYVQELTSGAASTALRNLNQGFWPGAPGVAVGNISGNMDVSSNIIEGPYMAPSAYVGCEYGGTLPNCQYSFGGVIPYTITANSISTSSTPTQHATTAPTISPAGGAFSSPPTVTFSNTQTNVSNFYTLDGSTPTTASTLYTGPFTVPSLPVTVKVLSQWGTGAATAFAFPAGYGWAPSTVTTATYTTTGGGTVTLTTTQPPYGWLVMPGAARTPIFYPSGSGATTKLLNYSVTGGATVSCTSNCLPEVTVTMPSSGGTCSVSGSVGSYSLTSTVRPILTATTVDTPTASVTVPFNVCNTTVDAFAVVEPAYQQAYKGQAKTLQSYVVGYRNQSVTWAITTAPGGGNATLSDTGNRDVIFSSGTVSGRYVLTATSVANGAISGTAIVFVSPNSLPAYSVTPNKTQPTECYVDPALTGSDYEVGSGQAYADLAALPLSSTWTAGSIVRIHSGTYANWMAVQGTGTPTQPIIICGIADGSGNLPIIDGFNATANASTPTVLNGLGGFALTGISSGIGQGYALGSVGPDYVTITGLQIRRFNYPYSYHAVPSGTLTPYGATGDSPSGIWIGSGQRIHMEGLDLEDDGWGVLANNNTGGVGTNNGRRFTAFHQFMGGHINNFSQPGSFSNHGLYMEGIYSLVDGNLFENPQYNLSDPTAPLYDNGDFIKMRGGASIIRYNMFRGILTGAAIWYPDMEDTVAFVDPASQFGQPGVANCSLSTWCSYTSNNITLTQLAENQETLAKDYFYGNVISNEAGNQAIALLTYGSYSALQECTDIGYWCTPGIDRSGQLYAWGNTFDQPSNWNSGNDSGVFLTANPFTSNYVAAAMPVQPTIFAANNVWWNDTACGGACFPFTVNVDATMIATFQTNMSAAGALPFSGTITGGSTTGWGGYTNGFSFPLANPMQAHLSGLTSGNFKTTASIPYNRTTFAPVGSSALISAGSQITLAEIAKMPVRYQPLNTGGVVARTDSASSTPTIGAVQTGSLPTFTAAMTPSPLTVPSADIGSQVFMVGTASFSDGTSSFIQFRSQPWASSNNPSITFFGTGPAGNVMANGSGTITTGFGGLTPSVNFTVGSTPAVANPTFNPVAGSYVGGQSVVISTSTSGASIVYTNDGTTPTVTSLTCTITHGTLYTGAVSVSTSQTLKAIGCKASDTASGVSTAAYTISIPAAPTGLLGTVGFLGTSTTF